jgi:hypothetical protein
MAHDVFISYAHQDKAVADAICAYTEEKHIRCWIAPRDVLSGSNSNWAPSIVEAINTAKIVVMVLSSSANSSPFVPKEMERAASKGKPIIPFRIENVTPSAEMELFVSSQHWLDALTLPIEQHIERLVNMLKNLLAGINENEASNSFLYEEASPLSESQTSECSCCNRFIACDGISMYYVFSTSDSIWNTNEAVYVGINDESEKTCLDQNDYIVPQLFAYKGDMYYNLRDKIFAKKNSNPAPGIIIDKDSEGNRITDFTIINDTIYYFTFNSYYRIFKRSLDGSGLTELTKSTQHRVPMACGGDKHQLHIYRNKIYFMLQTTGGITSIYTIDMNGENEKLLLSGKIKVATIYRDWIYFYDSNEKALCKIDLSGKNMKRIHTNVTIFCICDDMIYYIDSWFLFTSDLNGQNITRIVEIGNATDIMKIGNYIYSKLNYNVDIRRVNLTDLSMNDISIYGCIKKH